MLVKYYFLPPGNTRFLALEMITERNEKYVSEGRVAALRLRIELGRTRRFTSDSFCLACTRVYLSPSPISFHYRAEQFSPSASSRTFPPHKPSFLRFAVHVAGHVARFPEDFFLSRNPALRSDFLGKARLISLWDVHVIVQHDRTLPGRSLLGETHQGRL